MGIFGEGGLVSVLELCEVGLNLCIEGGVFGEVKSRVGLPGAEGNGLPGLPYR